MGIISLIDQGFLEYDMKLSEERKKIGSQHHKKIKVTICHVGIAPIFDDKFWEKTAYCKLEELKKLGEENQKKIV